MKENKQKLNWFGRIFSFFGKKEQNNLKSNIKSFNVARKSRLNNNNGFLSRGGDINSDVFTDGLKLMEMARESEKNSPFTRKYLNSMVNNVVGPTGFNLSIKGMDKDILDSKNNKIIENYFWEWAKSKNCDYSKRFSLYEMLELLARQLQRDGEVFFIKQRGGKELNPFGFSLQMLDVLRLDRRYNGINPKTNNRIIMSVEVDDFNRVIAYYIRKHIDSVVPGVNRDLNGSEYIRLNAEDVIYLYKPTDPEQIRGYSQLVAGLETLEQLTDYQEAELVNARVSASKMGFFISNDTNVNRLDVADEVDEEGNFISEVEPGTFHVLPNGYDYKENQTNFPATYDKFVKTNLRTLASAWNISYEDLSNDRENVNYSSIRAGLVNDRDVYKAIQSFIIEKFLSNVYEEFLKNSILNKSIKKFNGKFLDINDFEKFSNHQWRGRGFAWVDPQKDISASISAVSFGLSSRQREAEKLGIDLFEVFDELAMEKQLAESKGLDLGNADNILQSLADAQEQEQQNSQNNSN